MLRAHTRRDDLVGRLGGEEFVILVPGAAEAQLRHRRAGPGAARPTPGAPARYKVSASVGYARSATRHEDSLIESADRR